MNFLPRACLYFALLALPMLVLAQQRTRPDPADPKANVPTVDYASPLRQYRPLGDEPLSHWKTANEVVEKVGGWKAYAREAQEPDLGTPQTPTPQASPPSKPAHDGDAGQKKN